MYISKLKGGNENKNIIKLIRTPPEKPINRSQSVKAVGKSLSSSSMEEKKEKDGATIQLELVKLPQYEEECKDITNISIMNDSSLTVSVSSNDMNMTNGFLRQSYYSPKISTINEKKGNFLYNEKAVRCTNLTLTSTNTNLIANLSVEKENTSSEIEIKIEIDDLILLEEKLQEILSTIRNSKSAKQLCYEWWTFMSQSAYHDKIFGFFMQKFKGNDNVRKLLHESTIIEFLAITICYDSSKDNHLLASTLNLLKNLFYLIHQNFLIFCDVILNCFSEGCLSNLWLGKLQNVIASKISKRIKKGEHFTLLKSNNDNINSNLKNYFRMIPIGNKTFSTLVKIHHAFKNFNKISIYMINELFKESSQSHLAEITRNSSNSIAGQKVFLCTGNSVGLPSVTVPYLVTPMRKDFCLVLDMDETIVRVEYKSANDPVIHVRPYLFEFIEECANYYEMIVFTAGLQDYGDEIVDYLELKAGKKLFEHRLYRQHALVMNGEYVKDLSKIGRPLSRIIIVDNIQHNFKLQKDNGILIKSYIATTDDKSDTVLAELAEILTIIAQSRPLDIRRSLARHREEIVKKVSCS